MVCLFSYNMRFDSANTIENLEKTTFYHDDSADAHDLSGGGVRLTVKSGNCPDVTSPVNVFRYIK